MGLGKGKNLDHYCKRFAHLHTDKNRTRWTAATSFCAPHKILLLLSVIDLIEDKSLKARYVELTPDLLERFAVYWSAIMPPSRRGDIFLPFFHLRSEGFWQLVPVPGKEVLTYFDDELRQRLIDTVKLSRAAADYSRYLYQAAHEATTEQVAEDDMPAEPVRDQGFRRAVVNAYEHRCAICGIRMITQQGHTAVDAAHIVPWAESHNDAIRNGMALCKLCHWAFDEYLVSAVLVARNNYRIQTSRSLSRDPNLPGHLALFQGRTLWVPSDTALQPHPDCLTEHRRRLG